MFFFSKKSKGSERGAAIAAAGAIGLWQWDPDKGEFWFSSHARNLLQLEKSLPTLINVQKKIFTDDQAKFLQSFTDLHDDEFSMVMRVETAPEYYRWIRWRGKWQTLADHRYLSGTLQDVHEERLTQLELEFTQEMLSEAQRIARLGSWQYDLVSKHLFWSEETFHIFGRDVSLGAPQGKNQYRYFETGSADLLRDRARAAVRGGRPYEIDIPALRDDGKEITVRIIGRPLFDQASNPYLLVGTVQDITDWTDLKAAKDQTEQNQKAQSQFLASISHEIRTPMNAVSGMVQLLLRADLPKRQQEQAKVVLSATTDLLAIINDLLDMAKLESGQMTLETIEFDLAENLREIAVLHSGKIYGKNLEFIVELDQTLPRMVMGDPLRIKQVIGNLLSNAAKFTKEGQITLRAQVEGRAGTNVIVRFSVQDTGVGIPPHRLAAVFQKYVQAEISTAREYGGTGLGLAICQELVHMMGGDIQVTSDSQHGTRFWFDVPLTQVSSASDKPLNVRVLVLEPSEPASENLKEIFQQLGVDAEILSSPQQFLAALSNANPAHSHVIVADNAKYDSNTIGASVRTLSLANPPKLILLTLPIVQSVNQDIFDEAILRPVFAHDLRRALTAADDEKILSYEIPGANRPRILLAEDNHSNQQTLSAVLEELGYAPQLVGHGAAAVAAAKERHFAAIILDVKMPVTDGLDAARQIREREAKTGGQPQVILGLTGSANESDRAACLASGMNDIIVKPIMIDRLAEILQKYIKSTRKNS